MPASSRTDRPPRVSLITSVYDGDAFIADFLADVARQTIFAECELILIDAASPGDELRWIEPFVRAHNNVVYRRLERDPGLYAVWNLAIGMARAPLLTSANLDDRRHPEVLQAHARALEEDPGVDLVYSDFLVTEVPVRAMEEAAGALRAVPEPFSPEAIRRCLPGPQPMWRRSLHDRFGPFREDLLSAGDHEFWLRAVGGGARFKKVDGLSGVYYRNPRGLSTRGGPDAERRSREEWAVIEEHRHVWSPPPAYVCTAADSGYFACLLNLLGSLHETGFEELGEVVIFDLGLTAAQRAHVASIEKVTLDTVPQEPAGLLPRVATNDAGRTVPGWYAWKPVVIRRALERFPYVLWLDAGTTVLRPLGCLVEALRREGYVLFTIGDEIVDRRPRHPVGKGATARVRGFFHLEEPERAWILDQEAVAAGIVGVTREARAAFLDPWCALAQDLSLFADDGSSPGGFGTGRYEQTLLSVLAYLGGLRVRQVDRTQRCPMALGENGQGAPFFITWDPAYVSERTHIYQSRGDLQRLAQRLASLRYDRRPRPQERTALPAPT